MPSTALIQVPNHVSFSNRLKSLRIYLVIGLITGTHTGHADYEAGVNAAFAGDYDTAFQEFSLAASEGLDLAQYNLGILYFTGRGVEQDFEAAFKWTESAALQGHLAAQFNLATLLYEGRGTPRDRDQAVIWFTTAGKAGNADAAMVLAKMYQEGEHVQKDPVLAHAWTSMAVSNDHPDAAALRQILERRMSPEQLSQARRQFATWQID